MGIIERVKNICLTPATEWPVIERESATSGGLIGGYAAPLIAASAVAAFIGGSVVGGLLGRTSFIMGLSIAVLTFVMQIISVFVLSLIINALAPTFGGQQNGTQALKLAVYSMTPAWVAGLLQILPLLGLLGIIGGLYGIYLLYLGLPTLMRSPQDKAVGYTVVVVVCAIVLSVVTGAVVGAIGLAGAMGSGIVSGLSGTSSSDEVFDKDSPLGKLEQLGKAVEQSSKELETAQKSGDAEAAAAAAMKGLGALLGGGKRFDPLEIDQIKTFVPPTFAGLAKEGTGRAEKNGLAGLMVSMAEARYSDGAKRAVLEVTDTGGAAGVMGLASWAAVQSSSEDENGSERTMKVNGRLVHEKRSKNGPNEYAIVVGDRFVVNAKSEELGVDELKAAVSALDLDKLEAMKDVGASAAAR